MRSRIGSLAATRSAAFFATPAAASAASLVSMPSAAVFRAPTTVASVHQVRFCSSEAADADADIEEASTPSNDRDNKRRGDDTTNKIFFNNPELVLRKPHQDDPTKGCMVRIVQESEFLVLAIHQQNKLPSEPRHYTGGRTILRIAKVLATRMLAVIEGNTPSCELVTRSKTDSVVGTVKTNGDGTVSFSGKVTSIPQPGDNETTREFAVTFDLPECLMMRMFFKEYIHFTTGFHASGHVDDAHIIDDDDDDADISLNRRRRRDDRDYLDRRDDRDRRDFRRDDRRDDRREFRRDDRDRRDFRRDDRRDSRDRRDRDDRRGNDRDRRDGGDRRRDDRRNDSPRGGDRKEAPEKKKAEPATPRQYASSIY